MSAERTVTLSPRQRQDYELILANLRALSGQRDAFVSAITGAIREPGDDTEYPVQYADGVMTLLNVAKADA